MKFSTSNLDIGEVARAWYGYGMLKSSQPETSQTKRMRPRMAPSKNLRRPTEYVLLMNGALSEWALNEERALEHKGQWREKSLRVSEAHPVDLEIGTGNGYHFAHRANLDSSRALLGLELKFKPLIQTIKRTLAGGAKNARVVRYDAARLDDVFTSGELNNVYIHHPDPWPKERHWKHRLIQDVFLDVLFDLMRPGTFVEFKTDSLEYFEWAVERFHKSKFKVSRETRDLHGSEWARENFVTHFEALFVSQGVKINYAKLERA
jgi:tRNA (guanine-N7-)-methyltransferase